MKKRFNILTVVSLMLLVSALTFSITYIFVQDTFNKQLEDQSTQESYVAKFLKVYDLIVKNYVGDYDEQDLIDGAMAGMVAATGDIWSHYLTTEDWQAFEKSSDNEYVGIGVSASYDEEKGAIYISQVHPGTSAEEAGLKVGDLIVEVNGEKVSELGYQAAVAEIRGEEGTTVTLKLLMGTEKTEKSLTITRKSYQYDAVKGSILNNNIGYIVIENFDSRVSVDFEDVLNKLLDAGVKGLIFDVRFNPGGQLTTLTAMLDKLCPEGTLITLKSKSGTEKVITSDEASVDLPMVVLINENSISAAEFFAAALKDFGKAKLVGTPTVGKGYSQSPIQLEDGSGLLLSTSEYFTPKGQSLIGVGLQPDYKVELSAEKLAKFYQLTKDEDDQLAMAISVLNEMLKG